MRHQIALFFSSLFLLGLVEIPKDSVIHFEGNKIKKEGTILYTHKGAVFFTKDIRLQARNILYDEKTGMIDASDDLMFIRNGEIFIAEKLLYHLPSKTGTLTQGKTSSGLWFAGGKQIELLADMSCIIHDGYYTPYDNENPFFRAEVKKMQISKDLEMQAEKISFKAGCIPYFYLPSFSSHLKFFSNPPIRYKMSWEKGKGPRMSGRYRFYSNKNHELFGRVDYRPSRGFGFAFENKSRFSAFKVDTKSFVARDTFFQKEMEELGLQEVSSKRYRLQGLITGKSADERTKGFLSYDLLSDHHMVRDFSDDDFETRMRKNSMLRLERRGERLSTTLRFMPRINQFQFIKQELPLTVVNFRPETLGRTGIISSTLVRAGFLSYQYPHDLRKILPTQESGRIELQEKLSRTFSLPLLRITPAVKGRAIFYSKDVEKKALLMGAVDYGVTLASSFVKAYKSVDHEFLPYTEYSEIVHPTAGVSSHYIFNALDGIKNLRTVRFGVKNTLYSKEENRGFSPILVSDFYGYSFLNNSFYSKGVAKAFGNLKVSLASSELYSSFGWNFKQKELERFNCGIGHTFSQHFALSLELRFRSAFDFRKSDSENFFIDFKESVEAIKSSPLSDRRSTFLARADIKIDPRWSLYIESRNGFGRKAKDSDYFETKAAISRRIGSHFQGLLSYERVHKIDSVYFTIKMVP